MEPVDDLQAVRPGLGPRPRRGAAQAFRNLEAIVQVDPLEARERLSRYIDPVVLTPVEEDGRIEYDYDITLRNDSAALAGGLVSDRKWSRGRANGSFYC